MLIVSSGEFRANQKAYLDKVDDGHVLRAEDFAKEPDEELERAISGEEFKRRVLAHVRELFNTSDATRMKMYPNARVAE